MFYIRVELFLDEKKLSINNNNKGKKNSFYYNENFNSRITCFTNEENFTNFQIGEIYKFSGLVKAKPEDFNLYENTYEKIIEIYQIESQKKIISKDSYKDKKFSIENLKKIKKNNILSHEYITNNNKTKNNININSNLNFNIESEELNFDFFFLSNNFTKEDLIKFNKLSEYKCLPSFLLLNLKENNNNKYQNNFNDKFKYKDKYKDKDNLNVNIEFLDLLLFYFNFSKGTDLSIGLYDLTKTENITNILKRSYSLVKNYGKYFNFNNNNKNFDDFIAAKEKTKRSNCAHFELYLGEIFSGQNDFILFDNIPNNINPSISGFLSYIKSMNEFSSLNLSLNQDSFNKKLNFKGISSVIISSKVNNINFKSSDFINSNLNQMINFYDINYFYFDRLDTEKDRKNANEILREQFQKMQKGFLKKNNESQINSNRINIKSNNNNNNNRPSSDIFKNIIDFNKKRKFEEIKLNKNKNIKNNFEDNDNDDNSLESIFDNNEMNNNNKNNLESEFYYGFEINNSEDILNLDEISLQNFNKNKLKTDLKIIKSDDFLENILLTSNQINQIHKNSVHKKNTNKNSYNYNNNNNEYQFENENEYDNNNNKEISQLNFFSKFIFFCNNFIHPKFTNEICIEISNLAKALEELFNTIKSCEIIEFPNIEKLLMKFSFIVARIDMRNVILIRDVFESYLFLKEYLSLTLTFALANRKEMVNKNKKTKINFISEKIRQFCQSENTKIFTKKDIKIFCEEINNIDDFENLFEVLNFSGFLIKVNSTEYQLNA